MIRDQTGRAAAPVVVLRALRKDGTLPDSMTDAEAMAIVKGGVGGGGSGGSGGPTRGGRPGPSKPKRGKPKKKRACRVCGEEFDDVPALLEHIEASGHRVAPAKAGSGAARTAGATQGAAGGDKRAKEPASHKGNECGVCGALFGSRSKLFRHIEETGHALSREDVAAALDSRDRKKAKKKRKKGRKGRKGDDDDE